MNTSVRYISATRSSNGWTKPCKHSHRDLEEANLCAVTRSATIIVIDPDEISGKSAIVQAAHLADPRRHRSGHSAAGGLRVLQGGKRPQ